MFILEIFIPNAKIWLTSIEECDTNEQLSVLHLQVMMASLTLPGAATKMVLEVVTALLEVFMFLNFYMIISAISIHQTKTSQEFSIEHCL